MGNPHQYSKLFKSSKIQIYSQKDEVEKVFFPGKAGIYLKTKHMGITVCAFTGFPLIFAGFQFGINPTSRNADSLKPLQPSRPRKMTKSDNMPSLLPIRFRCSRLDLAKYHSHQ